MQQISKIAKNYKLEKSAMVLISLITHERIPSSNLLLSSHFRSLSAHPFISQCGKLSSIECDLQVVGHTHYISDTKHCDGTFLSIAPGHLQQHYFVRWLPGFAY